MAAHLSSDALRLSPPLAQSRRRDRSPESSPTRDSRRHLAHSDSSQWDVSPTLTLRAFTDGLFLADDTNDSRLLSGIKDATTAEKDLGARVATATKKLKAWCEELENWHWSGSFEAPKENNRLSQGRPKPSAINGVVDGLDGQVRDSDASDAADQASLSPAQVDAYVRRARKISEELEDLEMDELKAHVLDMHPAERPRKGNALSTKHASIALLDDFSFVVTQTMLQALPYLALLHQLTNTWSMRLSVLQDVPIFLGGLREAQTSVAWGWASLKPPQELDLSTKALQDWKNAIDDMREKLSNKIALLGQRLDRMLDALEDRDDVLPDHWIEEFEALESDYAKWSAQAQRRLFDIDMIMASPPRKLSRPSTSHGGHQVPAPDFASVMPPVPQVISNGVLESSGLGNESGSPNRNDSAWEVGRPKLLPAATFGPTTPFHPSVINKHQRTRSRSEPHIAFLDTRFTHRVRDELNGKTPTKQGYPQKRDITSNGNLDTKRADTRDESPSQVSEEPIREEKEQRPGLGLKRASITSIESFARSQVKSVVADRQKDNAINTERQEELESQPHRRPSQSFKKLDMDIKEEDGPQSPRTIDQETEAETPEPKQHQSNVPFVSSVQSSPMDDFDDSPSWRMMGDRPVAKAPQPELNATMKKRRPAIQRHDSDAGPNDFDANMLLPETPMNDVAGEIQRHRRASAATEDLERQIRRIITSVHAPIRLTSGSDTDLTPEYKAPRSLSVSGSRPPSSLRTHRSPVTPSMTLIPDNSGSARRSAHKGDPDIKIYHLMQPGKDKPIKLFVRRVGENGERVMVRVGGGWADLGEYLRQYAEHHGKRVASESGKFELLGVQNKIPDYSSPPTRPTSSHSNGGYPPAGYRPAGYLSRTAAPPVPQNIYTPPPANKPLPGQRSRPSSRPGSAMDTTHSTRARSASAMSKRPGSSMGKSPNSRNNSHTHNHTHSTSVATTPTIQQSPPPKPQSSRANSPSETNGSNSSQRSWGGEEVGLAGPTARKLDLSDEKREWIEGMMSQAKKLAGAGTGPGDGRTKKVFLRGLGDRRGS
ncbi:hypothetical protein K490DRAFT_54325 [Saccharata proteae CBS 121410]|uniref:GAR domain-containing protein n=1 Tax=Saccharata proteae CBS 121410 TaxID=1314787 RepID=A0A9P4LWT1_9PEZI|nr:hypothetical protein K490DRAFT_54325 [Saccharata proteae CBS 121410]